MIGVSTGGLSGGDTPEIVQAFVEQTGATFPVGWDTLGTYRAFRTGSGISPFPLDVIIDQQGRVAYVAREFDAAAMTAVVERLLAP